MARRTSSTTKRSNRARTTHGAGVGRAPGALTPRSDLDTKDTDLSPEREALVVSHWFDPGRDGLPYRATVRLTGRRTGLTGRPKSTDSFLHEEVVEEVVPGTGPISVTTWVYGLEPGDWNVSGELIRSAGTGAQRPLDHRTRTGAIPLHRAAWSWRRRRLSTDPDAQIKTRWALVAPLARSPGVQPGSWTAFAALGTLVALLTQALILSREDLSVARGLTISLIAIVFGLIGAKLWYRVLHPAPWRESLREGWAVDGFLVLAPLSAILLAPAFGLPIGTFLDATAPGIFFAVAIGRIGCFLTGCCAGRCTPSRWGTWSSDRRVGARRLPAQLFESVAGLMIGLAAAALVIVGLPGVDGLVFIGSFLAYGIVRQAMLRVRAESRKYSWQRRRLAEPV